MNFMLFFLQRITIAEILEDEWFKKDYKPTHFEQNDDVSLEDVDAAFDSSEVIQSECRFLVCSLLYQTHYVLKASLILLSFFYRNILWRRKERNQNP